MSSDEMQYSQGVSSGLPLKNTKPTNQPLPKTLICKTEPFLTSSDPVSDGLAFFGAITGESDPSKSSCKK